MARQTLNTTICRFQDKWGCPKREMLLAPILAFLFIGCVAPGRLADIGDCGAIGVGTGYGLDATVRFGAIAEGSFGVGHRIRYHGWDDVRGAGNFRPAQVSWPLSLPISAVDAAFSERSCILAFNQSFFHVHDDTSHFEQRPGNRTRYPGGKGFGNFLPLLSERRREQVTRFHNITKIEGDVALGAVGIRIGVNPLEILDFLLGFVGLDIARDDPPLPRPPESDRMEGAQDKVKMQE